MNQCMLQFILILKLYESLKWKELAAEKAKTGKMKQNLFDEITEEKIRSKTTDQAIAKTFRPVFCIYNKLRLHAEMLS